MRDLVPVAPPAIPTLPRDFDMIVEGMSKKERDAELRRRQAAFVKAKAQLTGWIRQDRNPLMTKTAKLVAAYLIECLNFETGRCFPSHETIADHLGISDRQVRRVIPRIVKAGWLSVVRVRRNAPTFYRFHAPEEAIRRIEEGALALRQSREDRRVDRRFPNLIEHVSMPEQQAVFLTPPDRTSASGEYLRQTSEIDWLYEEEEPLKVTAVLYGQDDEGDYVFPVPVDDADADRMLDEILDGLPRPKG